MVPLTNHYSSEVVIIYPAPLYFSLKLVDFIPPSQLFFLGCTATETRA